MSAVVTAADRVAAPRFVPARAVVLLGWREARRMVSSPVYLLILGGLLVVHGMSTVDGRAIPSRADIQAAIEAMLVYGALATLFAVSLVATSARRTGAESQFGAAPLDPQLRTLATGLGVLLGPTAVAAVLTAGLAYLQHGVGQPLHEVFTGWEYVQLPLSWLGIGMLGVAVARWLPWPGVPLAVLVGLIGWTVASAKLIHNSEAGGYLMPYVISSRDAFDLGIGTPNGQLGWHAGYLLGLCLLALAAALLRQRRDRGPLVLGFTALTAVLTASAAWLQLP